MKVSKEGLINRSRVYLKAGHKRYLKLIEAFGDTPVRSGLLEKFLDHANSKNSHTIGGLGREIWDQASVDMSRLDEHDREFASEYVAVCGGMATAMSCSQPEYEWPWDEEPPKRPPGRPSGQASRDSATQLLGVKLAADTKAWVTTQGGAAWVRELIERERKADQ